MSALQDLVLVCGYWFLLLTGVCAGAGLYVLVVDWRRARRAKPLAPVRVLHTSSDWDWPARDRDAGSSVDDMRDWWKGAA